MYTNKNEAEHWTIIKCFLKINMFQVNELVSQLTECRIKKFRLKNENHFKISIKLLWIGKICINYKMFPLKQITFYVKRFS